MPPVPPAQRSQYGPQDDGPIERVDEAPPRSKGVVDPYRGPRGPPDYDSAPHLTMVELAARWKRTRKTIERHYQEWGLRPLRFGGRLLFPISQVLEVEERAMRGELVTE